MHDLGMRRTVSNLLAVLVCLSLFAGCETINLNPAVTGTSCSGRAGCLEDLKLSNPIAPGYVFVVGPYKFSEMPRGSLGSSTGTIYKGDMDLCVAKALQSEYGDGARIVFDSKGIAGPFVLLTIRKASLQNIYSFGWQMKVDYTLSYGGKSAPMHAETPIKNIWSADQAARTQYLAVCAIIARQVKEKLPPISPPAGIKKKPSPTRPSTHSAPGPILI